MLEATARILIIMLAVVGLFRIADVNEWTVARQATIGLVCGVVFVLTMEVIRRRGSAGA